MSMQAHSYAEGRRAVQQGATLLDVRTREEFHESHLPGAINIPVHELESRTHELRLRSRAVVVYCRSGNRSATAASVLRSAGYVVFDVGAMDNW